MEANLRLVSHRYKRQEGATFSRQVATAVEDSEGRGREMRRKRDRACCFISRSAGCHTP